MLSRTPAKYFTTIIVCVLLACNVFAQKADFTADKTGGCSPLDVRFTNTSTGLSASADYKWEFGNGNTSKLFNSGTTYLEEKTYSVKLTATDGGKTYTKTMDITVYKKPQVNFDAYIKKGCLPLSVTFTSSSTAGDGSISNYFWDFGDGVTQQSNSPVQHVYNTAQTVTAGLTVTNSKGCYATVSKTEIVKVLPAINASFDASKKILCRISDAAAFTNNSTGPGTLSYTWDFGDSKTSTDKEPSHVYTAKGTYNVKLSVKSSEGCVAEVSQAAFINVANFLSDFSSPPLVCENTNAIFSDKSNPVATDKKWYVDGQYYSGYYGDLYFTPSSPGNYKVQLVNTYGSCKDTATKTITVKQQPKIGSIIADLQGACGSPAIVKFKDTSSAAVKWEWDFNNYYNFNPTSFIQAPPYTYNSDNSYNVVLRITNAEGCSKSTSKTVTIYRPNVYIYSPKIRECKSLTTTFTVSSNVDIKNYNWNFNDGSTSTEASPTHTFSKPGSYNVSLNYTNKDDCKGTVFYNIIVYEKPVFDFKASPDTVICGNNPVQFTATGTNLGDFYWSFGDNNYDYIKAPTHQYFNDTTYTVRLIVTNGTCADTVTKIKYIKVLPPFPKISTITNTCEGTRGEVTIVEISRKANKLTWDFGDNTTPLSYTNYQPETKHTYTKTGTYKVVLTATNGTCSVRDSLTAYVLLKQKPVLTSTQTYVCESNRLNTQVSGLETNPHPYYYYTDFNISKIEYGDKSTFYGYYTSNSSNWRNSFDLTLSNFDNQKKDFRYILQSTFFGCNDTTNFIPVQIKGPTAGFEITDDYLCFKKPAIFKDTSKGNNDVPIVKWEWTYGDNKMEVFNKGDSIKHIYSTPGNYYVMLKVTDKDGCTNSSSPYNNYVRVRGPKADFNMSPNPVSPDDPVFFYNNTNNTNSYDTYYKWYFGDGATSTADYYTYHSYANPGIDTVILIARNDEANCADTVIQYLRVKNLNLGYTYTTSFINPGSGCPPVVARFTNTSINTVRVSWDFGDGGTADNLNFPSHTYEKPGVYKITLHGFFDNGKIDSTYDYITIKGPYANLQVDKLFACGSDPIRLTAEAKNTSSFTWDFGDGTLLDLPDTFAVHSYLTPGIYTPALIVKDGEGCSFPFFLQDKIIIDTLHFTISHSPEFVCDSSLVKFTPDIFSLAKNELQQTLQYSWQAETPAGIDSSTIEQPSFLYTKTGKYPLSLTITSPYGCVAEATDTITVKPIAKGSIAGPAEICEEKYATFTATANSNNALLWQWHFPNNNSSSVQNPPSQLFNDAGSDSVRLIVNNDGCLDTTYKILTVHAKPIVDILPKEPQICVGDSVQLIAHDGVNYLWTPANKMSDAKIYNPFVSPMANTKYVAQVTNVFGCINTDSVTINVTQHFTIQTDPEINVCRGKSVELSVEGADNYQWISGAGLNNNSIANPVATIDEDENYIVVGYDKYGCFTDTAFTTILVKPLPFVNAGEDITMLAGEDQQLQTTSSSDVIKWKWQPADYLSCINCPNPVTTPHSNITYIEEVTNNFGCIKKDSITVNIICKQSRVFIPNAFTPGDDGKNDGFSVLGKGIKLIRHLVIFDRWGKAVFEKRNITTDDKNARWDGTHNGDPLPTGVYIYMADILCDAGDIFNFKGSVTLIR